MVLATAQGRMEAREGADFFPLTVDVEGACTQPGRSRRVLQAEGRPTERAIPPHA
jgi:polyribonucleotide nucleotidyltransferase